MPSDEHLRKKRLEIEETERIARDYYLMVYEIRMKPQTRDLNDQSYQMKDIEGLEAATAAGSLPQNFGSAASYEVYEDKNT